MTEAIENRRSGWTLLLLGVAFLLVVGAAVYVLVPDDPAEDVFAVGDSLTVDAALAQPWPPGWLVDAAYGRTTEQGREIVAGLDLEEGIPVIVALGTNDGGDDPATFGRRIDRMVEAIGPGHRIIWVNVDSHTPELAGIADGVNPALADATERHPELEVADWDEYVTTVDDFDAMRNPDGVHYLPEGARLRSEWMVGLVSSGG